METTERRAFLTKRFELESYKINATIGTGSFEHERIYKEKEIGWYIDVKILKNT